MKTTVLQVFSGFVMASLALASEPEYNPSSSELSPAPILVKRVKGDVKATTQANSTPFRLKPDTKIKQGTTIITGPRSEATLIFSNGSALGIDPDSRVHIVEFLQAGGMDMDIEPHGEGTAKPGMTLASMGKEPSISKTRIHVSRGTAYARVKKLHKQSSYVMTTPLGQNKVRGTAWKQSNIVNRQNRQMISTAAVGEGSTEFDPIDVNGTTNDPTLVKAGREIEVTGTFGSLNDLEQVENITNINAINLDVNVNVNVQIAMNERSIGDPNFNNALNEATPSPDVSITTPPSTGGEGGGGGFSGGGILPGTAGIGAGGGGGGGTGGDDGDDDDGPTPTPTPPPPSS